jgi:hypothetical protein
MRSDESARPSPPRPVARTPRVSVPTGTGPVRRRRQDKSVGANSASGVHRLWPVFAGSGVLAGSIACLALVTYLVNGSAATPSAPSSTEPVVVHQAPKKPGNDQASESKQPAGPKVVSPSPPNPGNNTFPSVSQAQPPKINNPEPKLPSPDRKVQAFEPKGHAGRSVETCGTAIDFVGSPAEAALLAKQTMRLQFILHVSGNFEDTQFT